MSEPKVDVLRNPLRDVTAAIPPLDPDVWEFHRRMPGYAPTLLVDCPRVAESLGVGRVLVKAETRRLGLPSFKILGASWATYRAVCERLGHEPRPWTNITELATQLEELRPFALAAATDGNHGRAVAFMARTLGFSCRIFVPEGTTPARISAIESEGARVVVVDGDYDEAVRRSAREAEDRCLVISDTSWPGYETTPARVSEGYATIFDEVDFALASSDIGALDAVFVPVGVGALMSAAVRHYRAGDAAGGPLIVGVEPIDANCVAASAEAGELVTVPGPHRSIMVGLNCGTASMIGWPIVAAGVDVFVSIDDDWARHAMVTLADAGVVAGETGAAALAGLTALVDADLSNGLSDVGERLGPDSTVLLLCTEGATDPGAYRDIVGRDPESVGQIVTAAT